MASRVFRQALPCPVGEIGSSAKLSTQKATWKDFAQKPLPAGLQKWLYFRFASSFQAAAPFRLQRIKFIDYQKVSEEFYAQKPSLFGLFTFPNQNQQFQFRPKAELAKPIKFQGKS